MFVYIYTYYTHLHTYVYIYLHTYYMFSFINTSYLSDHAHTYRYRYRYRVRYRYRYKVIDEILTEVPLPGALPESARQRWCAGPVLVFPGKCKSFRLSSLQVLRMAHTDPLLLLQGESTLCWLGEPIRLLNWRPFSNRPLSAGIWNGQAANENRGIVVAAGFRFHRFRRAALAWIGSVLQKRLCCQPAA